MSAYPPSNRLPYRLARWGGDLLAPRDRRQARLCVLNYHRILERPDPLLAAEPDVRAFEWQMQVLANCFNVLPLDRALALLGTPDMPARAVCITFDDGYRSTHDLALPVLRKFGLSATVFVTTGFMGHGAMWNDKILEAIRDTAPAPLDLASIGMGNYPLATLEQRQAATSTLIEEAKYLAPEGRATLLAKLASVQDGKASDEMMTEEMIRTLSENGVEIGAHTVSHPILTRLDDASASAEMADSKTHLERVLGKPVRYFAYPNGKPGMDFDERHVAMAKAVGFGAAFTTEIGAAKAGDDRHRLPRSRPWDNSSIFYVLRLLRWLTW